MKLSFSNKSIIAVLLLAFSSAAFAAENIDTTLDTGTVGTSAGSSSTTSTTSTTET